MKHAPERLFEIKDRAELAGKTGILPSQHIEGLWKRNKISADIDINSDQIQPASLDLRLGRRAWRVRASFLPGKSSTVGQQLRHLAQHEMKLEHGAVFEHGCVYVVELLERLSLPNLIAAAANPKSSTGRIDVFTRLITDKGEAFDWVEPGYAGPLYAEIFPRTFSIKARTGSRLNQLRFLRRVGNQQRSWRPELDDYQLQKLDQEEGLVDGASGNASIRHGLNVSVDLRGSRRRAVVGYRALKFADLLDVEKRNHRVSEFWEPIYSNAKGRIILQPNEFYILASKERIMVPPQYAAEMIPIDPTMGEFRAHYAGFFDPGFGWDGDANAGSRAVLEVRTLEIPFVLEHSQPIARLVYENLAARPERIYGQGLNSHYQGQGLKLSKHFK